ncbi:hypothetical protein X947_5112 [Burkholderia pseudomallei MSHR7334]|nr:hypothetical protein X947_5112 [Burkholderia pseudomallei MSHR7334]
MPIRSFDIASFDIASPDIAPLDIASFDIPMPSFDIASFCACANGAASAKPATQAKAIRFLFMG